MDPGARQRLLISLSSLAQDLAVQDTKKKNKKKGKQLVSLEKIQGISAWEDLADLLVRSSFIPRRILGNSADRFSPLCSRWIRWFPMWWSM